MPLSRTEVPISKNVRIGDLGLGSACVLTVLEKADYPNPLTYVQVCDITLLCCNNFINSNVSIFRIVVKSLQV